APTGTALRRAASASARSASRSVSDTCPAQCPRTTASIAIGRGTPSSVPRSIALEPEMTDPDRSHCRMLTTLVLALLGMSQPPRYHVDAIWFATEPNIPLHYLVLHADTTRVTDAADIFWLLRSQGMSKRVILFDAGYYRPEIMVKTKPARYERPSDAIRKLGVAPEAVTDVIVSHVHSDHVDGADLFPNAHIWIQKDEYEHYVDARGMPLSSTIDTVDAVMLAALKSQGRLTLIDGDDKEIIPGITVYTGGRHTYGSQYVGVATPAGTVVL